MDDYQKWEQNFCKEWVGTLLTSLEKNCTKEQCAKIFRPCGACHLKSMEPMLKQFSGNLRGLLDFLKKEWGQTITYDEKNGTILVDENKDRCVCPIAKSLGGGASPVLCECSAEMTAGMIAEVTGKKVKARVVSSILRGGKSCVYEIRLN